MNIKSEVYLRENATNKIVAMATIVIDESFVVKGLKVMEGSKGYFVAMPNRKNAKGEYVDTAYPITKEAREQIQQSVLEEYERKLNESSEQFAAEQKSDLPF